MNKEPKNNKYLGSSPESKRLENQARNLKQVAYDFGKIFDKENLMQETFKRAYEDLYNMEDFSGDDDLYETLYEEIGGEFFLALVTERIKEKIKFVSETENLPYPGFVDSQDVVDFLYSDTAPTYLRLSDDLTKEDILEYVIESIRETFVKFPDIGDQVIDFILESIENYNGPEDMAEYVDIVIFGFIKMIGDIIFKEFCESDDPDHLEN